MKILIVDDNEALRLTLGVMLETMGHEPITVKDGKECFAAAIKTAPDVIIIDIGLPDMSGNDLCRELRTIRTLARTTIIAQTGHSGAAHRKHAQEVGFDHYLVKPVPIERWLDLLDECGIARRKESSGSQDAGLKPMQL